MTVLRHLWSAQRAQRTHVTLTERRNFPSVRVFPLSLPQTRREGKKSRSNAKYRVSVFKSPSHIMQVIFQGSRIKEGILNLLVGIGNFFIFQILFCVETSIGKVVANLNSITAVKFINSVKSAPSKESRNH